MVCHVENIALLLESHQDFKQSIKAKTVPLLEGTIRLDARFSCEWISDLSRAGFPSFSGISGLECLHDLFGELTLREAHFVHKTDLISLTCKFSTSDNRWVSFFHLFVAIVTCSAHVHLVIKMRTSKLLNKCDKIPESNHYRVLTIKWQVWDKVGNFGV